MRNCLLLLSLALTLPALPGTALAQPAPPPLPPGNTLPQAAAVPQPMAGMPGMAQPPRAAMVPLDHGATQEFNAEMTRMMSGMSAPYSGDADRDFVTHMLPHHQGAVEMAETELKYGHDAKLKQLAARIISAQQREIAFMQAWLDKHPAPAAPSVPAHAQVK